MGWTGSVGLSIPTGSDPAPDYDASPVTFPGPFLNNWGPGSTPRYQKGIDGTVTLSGTLTRSSGAPSVGEDITAIPADRAPATNQTRSTFVTGGVGTMSIQITTTGAIKVAAHSGVVGPFTIELNTVSWVEA